MLRYCSRISSGVSVSAAELWWQRPRVSAWAATVQGAAGVEFDDAC